MTKARYIFIICLMCLGMAASAQTYEQVRRRNVWSTSGNINGMRLDTASVSYAELAGSYAAGEFRDTWQPQRSWSAGASTASIRHLEDMTLVGGFSFTQTQGYDMCGSMFISPGMFPVDVLEFTPGTKILQTYKFDGGLSYDLSSDLKVGAMMDFKSANIAKRKDLRHANYQLDMTVSPGVLYQDGDFTFGANYVLRKVSETIELKQVGTKVSSYDAFLDKGMMYGVYSVWSGSGLHLDEAGVGGFPVKEMHSGAALQVMYKDLYAEVEYSRMSGTVGEKDFIWFRYPGNVVSAHVGYQFSTGDAMHYFRIGSDWRNLDLRETVLEKITEGGVTNVYNHGFKRILARSQWHVHPEYEYASDAFDILVDVSFDKSSSVSSQIYPYIYKESMTTWSAGVEAKLYLSNMGFARLKGFELDAGFRFRDGCVSEDEQLVAEGTGVQTEPFRLQEWYDRQMEFAIASALNARIALRYSFWKGLYVKASGEWQYGMDLKYIPGSTRATAALSIGLDF